MGQSQAQDGRRKQGYCTRIHTLKLLCNCLDRGSLGLRLLHAIDARCDQVAVTIHIVDASGCRPELGLAHPGRGERSRLARVWPVPLVRQHNACRMRRMLWRARQASAGALQDRRRRQEPWQERTRQRRTFSTLLSLFAAPVSICLISWRMAIIASQKRSSSACTRDASARNQSLRLQAAQCRANLALALCRLDHERARHRPGHGRRVVAIVNQALSNVLSLNASGHL